MARPPLASGLRGSDSERTRIVPHPSTPSQLSDAATRARVIWSPAFTGVENRRAMTAC